MHFIENGFVMYPGDGQDDTHLPTPSPRVPSSKYPSLHFVHVSLVLNVQLLGSHE